MKFSNAPLFRSLLVLVAATLSSCGGGGGGGDDFIGAAEVQLSISPQRIDTGDRTEVKIELSRLHEKGIALKVRFPKGLEYVPSSSFLTVGKDDEDVTPTVNQGKESDVYLVYYIAPTALGDEDRGSLFFELEGTDGIDDGLIEVDPDVDDPNIDNATEFNIDEPQFGAEDEGSIQVID